MGLGARYLMEIDGAPTAEWEVTEFNDGKSFTWVSQARGVNSAAHHIVEPAGAGSRVTLGTKSTGLMATLLGPLINRVARRNVIAEAEGLKRRCENERQE